MNEPEALRLADALDDRRDWYEFDPSAWCPKAAAELRRLHAENEILRAERDHARASFENAVKLLTGINLLLYPPATTLPDGRTMVFRPKDPDPHTVLQELSDRIRALPDEIAAIDAAEGDKE